MNCPICGKLAKTSRGLRGHLIGTRPYGGHELEANEASYAVAACSARTDEDSQNAEGFLEKALRRLIANKELPKYQFERCVDPFLGMFLEEIVAAVFECNVSMVKLVAQEFPLKKSDNNRSTNVDYVLFVGTQHDRPWVFVELKTDDSSISQPQALVYLSVLKNATMLELIEAVEPIKSASSKGHKYARLLSRFPAKRTIRGHAQLLYLTPKPIASAVELLPKGTPREDAATLEKFLTCVTFSDPRITSLQPTEFKKTWKLFRDEVLSRISADPREARAQAKAARAKSHRSAR